MIIGLITFENQNGIIRRVANVAETSINDLSKIWEITKHVYVDIVSKHNTRSYDNMCVDDAQMLNNLLAEKLQATMLNVDYDNYDKKINAYISYSYFSLYLHSSSGYYKTYIINSSKNNNCMSRACSTCLQSKANNISNIIASLNNDNPARNLINDYKTSDIYDRDIASLRNVKAEAEHLIKMCNAILEHITDTTIYMN